MSTKRYLDYEWMELRITSLTKCTKHEINVMNVWWVQHKTVKITRRSDRCSECRKQDSKNLTKFLGGQINVTAWQDINLYKWAGIQSKAKWQWCQWCDVIFLSGSNEEDDNVVGSSIIEQWGTINMSGMSRRHSTMKIITHIKSPDNHRKPSHPTCHYYY